MLYSYSRDQERYYGPFSSREEAIAAAQAEGCISFWTAENRAPDPLMGICADDVIEQVQQLEDFWLEQAEDWPGASREQLDDLTARLRQTFHDWMTNHNLTPHFWLAEEVQEHNLTAEVQ